jgi:hypothetical protein
VTVPAGVDPGLWQQAVEAAAKDAFEFKHWEIEAYWEDAGESVKQAWRDSCARSLVAALPVLQQATRQQAADEIAGLVSPNCELRYDGSVNPIAAAWVEGIRDAHTAVLAPVAARVARGETP